MCQSPRKLEAVALALLAMLLVAGKAQATLIGSTITVFTNFDGDTATESDLAVGDGPEVVCPPSYLGVCDPNLSLLSIDANDTADTIEITLNEYLASASINIFAFSGLAGPLGTPTFSFIGDISGTPILVSVGDHEVSVDLAGMTAPTQGTVRLNLKEASGQAPEPSTLLLLGAGLLGLAARRRKV